jgi:tetraacyldisaccharide 4'-kinase
MPGLNTEISARRSLLTRLLSLPWGGMMSLRRALFRRGHFSSSHPRVPTIAIGNISLGGTGKTPLTQLIAQEFARGKVPTFLNEALEKQEVALALEPCVPAILSRGYGRKGSGYRLVSSGGALLLPVHEAGDEPALLALSCPGVRVAVCESRLTGAENLISEGANLLILDDAYQHLSIQRDLNILVWDCTVDPSKEPLLPFGRLRETPAAALAADLIIFSRPEQGLLDQRVQWFESLFRSANQERPSFCVMDLCFGGLVPAPHTDPADRPKGPYAAFCGLGKPAQFYTSLEEVLGQLSWKQSYPDHHWYTPRELKHLADKAAKTKVILITTWKDAMRLPKDQDLPLWVATQKIEVLSVEEYRNQHAGI